MNNHAINNFMTAQAPMSLNGGAAAALGQAPGAAIGGDLSGAPGVGADGTPGGVGPNDLDQLQQAYNRTGDRGSQHHPIAEFLYQLTKMLTDDNSEIIEWVDGRIKVHHPERLESEVLHKYFRHSKFASFQRQLNYFGFRKIAGKGKMSPCSYVNEAATSDIRSLLLIKRKTNGSAARKAAMAQRTMQLPPGVGSHDLRANLSALAAGAAAATGAQPGINRLGNPAAFGAAALFSQGPAAAAAAAGLGQFPSALQQKSAALAAGGNLFLNNNDAMASFLMSSGGQKQPSAENLLQQSSGLSKTPSAPSIEQLHAQLAASLANRQQSGLTPQLNPSASLGLASSALNSATAAAAAPGGAAPAPGGDGAGPASAALNATAALNNLQQPQAGSATAAVAAAAGAGGGPASAALSAAAAGGAAAGNSLFDSATNLKSLVGDQQRVGAPGAAAAPSSALGATQASQQLLSGRLPSSNALFPDSLSTASFGNLLASSNRLSSLLSLNSFLSRDPSTADLLGVLPQGATAASQLAANQAAASQAAAAAGMDNKFGMPRFQ